MKRAPPTRSFINIYIKMYFQIKQDIVSAGLVMNTVVSQPSLVTDLIVIAVCAS